MNVDDVSVPIGQWFLMSLSCSLSLSEKVEQYVLKENEDPNVADNPTPVVTTHPVICVGELKRVTQHVPEPPLPKPFPLPRNFPPIVAIAPCGFQVKLEIHTKWHIEKRP